MHFSPLELAVVAGTPLLLCGIVWWTCRRSTGWVVISLGFVFGALAAIPIARGSNFLSDKVAGFAGHYYADALIEELLATAIPEEWGKSLVALVPIFASRKWKSPHTWIISGAAAHGGFAAVEGVFGSLSNEGWLQVLVGRTLGSLSHVCWGIIFMFFAWWGTIARGSRLICSVGVIAPLLLHTLINASLAESPGAEITVTDEPTLLQLMMMLSGLASLAVSVFGALFCVLKARDMENENIS